MESDFNIVIKSLSEQLADYNSVIQDLKRKIHASQQQCSYDRKKIQELIEHSAEIERAISKLREKEKNEQ